MRPSSCSFERAVCDAIGRRVTQSARRQSPPLWSWSVIRDGCADVQLILHSGKFVERSTIEVEVRCPTKKIMAVSGATSCRRPHRFVFGYLIRLGALLATWPDRCECDVTSLAPDRRRQPCRMSGSLMSRRRDQCTCTVSRLSRFGAITLRYLHQTQGDLPRTTFRTAPHSGAPYRRR